MASTIPPTYGVAFKAPFTVFDASGKLKAGATFGTCKISKDYGADATTTNAPTEISNGKYYIQLTATEQQCYVSGVSIPVTTASTQDASIWVFNSDRRIDDLTFPVTSGRSTDVDASGRVLLQPTQAGVTIPTVTTLTNAPSDSSGITTLLARIASALTITTGKVDVNDKTGFSLSAGGIQAIWDALTSALTTVGSIGKLLVDNINATISSRLSTAGYTAPDNTTITAINAKTTNLPALPSATGDAMTLTTGERNSVADALLKRDWNAVTGEASRSLLNACRFLRNRWYIVATTLHVTKEDDVTDVWTGALSTQAGADPITGIDPT